jgi:hypothetical protein
MRQVPQVREIGGARPRACNSVPQAPSVRIGVLAISSSMVTSLPSFLSVHQR